MSWWEAIKKFFFELFIGYKAPEDLPKKPEPAKVDPPKPAPAPAPKPPTAFGLKVKTRIEAVQRYGSLSISGNSWPNQDKWMTFVLVPKEIQPFWKNGESGKTVDRIYCNKDMAPSLSAALDLVVKHGLVREFKTYDGCLNVRYVRGTKQVSTHAYGLAIDINAAQNPLGQEHSNFSTQFVKCFTDCGFTWGGNFSGRKDNMHFSYAWE